MELNKQEVDLLNSDPNSLIVRYQGIIKIIVHKFSVNGYINGSNTKDYIQLVNEKLLNKIPKIKEFYDGSTLLKTYFSVVIRNICLEEFRKEKKLESIDIETVDFQIASGDLTDKEVIIKEELTRLDNIFRLFYDKRFKLEFCLKAIYRIKLFIEDFTKYCIIHSLDKIKLLLEKINPPKKISERDIYAEIKPFINKCDGKDNSADAIRKWIKQRIDEIIALMNGKNRKANYDRETIQILIEKYYYKS